MVRIFADPSLKELLWNKHHCSRSFWLTPHSPLFRNQHSKPVSAAYWTVWEPPSAAARSQAAAMAMDLIGEAGGQSNVTLLARGKKAALLDAALYNATAAHALDFDDTLSPPCAIAGLALAEQRSLSGRELLTKLCSRF